MNALGFFILRIGWQVGIRRERARWGAVNRETQILSEAEDLLGRLAWRDVQDVEDLSGEYWQIRDVHEQQEKLRQETRDADARNELLKGQLEEIEARHDERLQGLKDRKAKRMEEALDLMREIEQLKDWKETTKKKFLNLKAKIKVILKQDTDMSAEVDKTRVAMTKLKGDFSNDLTEIAKKTQGIEDIEREVDELERRLVEGKVKIKEETAEMAGEIGRLSKTIAELSAKIGALENTKSEFFYQVGHFLSNNIETKDPAIRSVLRKHRPLISRITYFRRSIAYNQRLARRSQVS